MVSEWSFYSKEFLNPENKGNAPTSPDWTREMRILYVSNFNWEYSYSPMCALSSDIKMGLDGGSLSKTNYKRAIARAVP